MTTTDSEMMEDPVRPVIDDELVDRLMAQVDAQGLELLGPEGVLTELTSRILSRGLEVEMADHLGYEKGDPAGWGSGNNRNGSYPKTVQTDAGTVGVEMPRDLHDGAQQQVVALKVKLGLARTIAEKEGAGDLAARVADLADQTQVAVDAMRIVARGIYPPLLEAEGLGSALAAVHRTVNLPTQIDSPDLPRYSRQVEETVYFCVVAAVGRAEMVGATSAHVTVHGSHEWLTVKVSYDSTDDGSDLTALTDRIHAFGGTVTTVSSGDGTTLTVQLPVEAEVMEPT